MRDFLSLPRLTGTISEPGVIEGGAENILCMGRQVFADGRRQIGIARIGHGTQPSSPGNLPFRNARNLTWIKASERESLSINEG
jgi:hypothetical protein